jgi:hypothetical protein
VVVLPAPFGPKKPTISPGAMLKETSSTALTAWYLRKKNAHSDPATPGSF